MLVNNKCTADYVKIQEIVRQYPQILYIPIHTMHWKFTLNSSLVARQHVECLMQYSFDLTTVHDPTWKSVRFKALIKWWVWFINMFLIIISLQMRVNKYKYADSQDDEEYAARHSFRLLPVMRRKSINIHLLIINYIWIYTYVHILLI